MDRKKLNVLFIGSFKSAGKSGNVGGQMYACTSLINSNLSQEVNWILVDSTATTNNKRSLGNRLFHSLKRFCKVLFYLFFFNVDVVIAFCSSGHSFLEKGTMLRIAKFLGKRTIIAPRSGYLLDDIQTNSKFKEKVLSVFSSCDNIICQGNFWFDFFHNSLNQPKDKLVVILNWININDYLREKDKVNEPIIIVFLGWVDENKGIWILLEAVRRLRDRDFILKIAGNGSAFDELSNYISSHKLEGKVQLLNWVYSDRKKNLLNQADIFVLPSFREGLPNSLLEAIASRTAIVSTDVGAISDIVIDGVNGRLIDVGDVDQLVNAISFFLDNPFKIEEYADKAFTTLTEKSSIDNAVAKFRDLFFKIQL